MGHHVEMCRLYLHATHCQISPCMMTLIVDRRLQTAIVIRKEFELCRRPSVQVSAVACMSHFLKWLQFSRLCIVLVLRAARAADNMHFVSSRLGCGVATMHAPHEFCVRFRGGRLGDRRSIQVHVCVLKCV